MTVSEQRPRDLSTLSVLLVGALLETEDPFMPYRLVDACGADVEPAAEYLRELRATGCAVSTQRSYGMDLLRWFRFLWAVDVPWNRADRRDAADFSCWILHIDKPRRSKSRTSSALQAANAVTGKPMVGPKYAARTVAHSETVLRSFYDFHQEAGTGPILNPFPLARQRRTGRVHAHHNPMEPFRNEQVGLFRPKIPQRVPRCIPDDQFDQLFAALGSHRNRALVAFYVSTGARASELLGARRRDADPGRGLITVVRKGTREAQQLPASPDAFVWLRLYQQQLDAVVGPRWDQPLWWTMHRTPRPLTYHAARAVLVRAQAQLGSNWTLHDLRHTAAYRMAQDPQMPLTDVQWVMGHARLSTTQLYLTPPADAVVAGVLAHHARRQARPTPPAAAPQYQAESLADLFGQATL
ncbi:tyrosine-type recombinase/integrase [Streptomyces sp. RPT161]|uniref:tyrosine-type recombinase/integrase n=1 Tax=Streptomyces sp. RPT161 TaxID=3015993 RepID=UPI0022B90364|nr:site-specific integrase [Streptomyces sp. RPT161]